MNEPLSEQRIAEIRKLIDGFQYGTLTITSAGDHAAEAYNAHHGAKWAIVDLLAEVERLRRERIALANFPTVMNILDAALAGDAKKARSYAELLAHRYGQQGRPQWANSTRRRLAPDYDPGPTYYLADADKE